DRSTGTVSAVDHEGHGVRRREETDYWRERLHIERAVEMMKITTTKQINKNLKNLPPDVETILYDTLTAYYRRTKDLWGIEAVALQILSRRQPRHENIVEDNFNDNKNAWKIINAVSSNTGRIRRLGRGRLQITGNGTIVLLPTVLPAAQNFSATATIYANDKAAVGLVVCSGKLMVDPLIAPAERSTYGVRLMSGGFF